ncbi:MAG: alkaline phosphatase [Actinomycetota bacterium]|jgi:alkaline phosphatase D
MERAAETYDRRTVLKAAGLGGAGALLALGLARRPAQADESLAPFLHGVASGDPTATSVILWTRVTTDSAGAVPMAWRVARDAALTDVVATGTTVAAPERDHTVKVDVGGLQPGAWYFYEFEALGKRSLTGRTKTAPAPGQAVDRLKFAVVSCANYQGGFFNAYAAVARRQDIDAVIHTGDYLYEYPNGAGAYGPGEGELSAPRNHVPDNETVTLADYRARHGSYRLDPDLRRLHQLFPMIVVWDDHETCNDTWREGAENHDPASEGDFGVRKAAAQRAYAEWMPMRGDNPAVIWRSLPYGDLVDIVTMDTRLERDKQVGTLGTLITSPELSDPARKMISDPQREFLFGRLSASTATWRIISQQVVLGQWNAGGLPDPGLPDSPKLIRDGGNALNPDAWDGYTAERGRLFDHLIDNEVDNVVVLTGDVHSSWAIDLTPDPYNPLIYNPLTGEGSLGVEVVCPAVSSATLGQSSGAELAAAIEADMLLDNPQVQYVDLEHHGYVLLDVTAERAQADWYYVDTVLQPSETEVLGASWASAAGDNHFVEAAGAAPGGVAAPATPGNQPRVLAATAPSGEVLPVTGGGGLGAAPLLAAAAVGAKLLERRARLSSAGETEARPSSP